LLSKFLKAKIHRAVVTGADLEYEGSIGIDADLLEAVGLVENEAVHVWNMSNGERIETYVIRAAPGSGEICLNGAAARLFHAGDKVIIASFCWIDEAEMARHKPRIVIVDEQNRVSKRI
jgi:aspartate 1-decarboxylase